MRNKAKRLRIEQIMKKRPDVVPAIFDCLVDLGILKRGEEDGADRVVEDEAQTVKPLIEAPLQTQKRQERAEREKQEKAGMDKSFRNAKVPTKYWNLRGLSESLLRQLIVEVAPAYTETLLEQFLSVRGKPDQSKANLLNLIEALTGVEDLKLNGDYRFFAPIIEYLAAEHGKRAFRYGDGKLPRDYDFSISFGSGNKLLLKHNWFTTGPIQVPVGKVPKKVTYFYLDDNVPRLVHAYVHVRQIRNVFSSVCFCIQTRFCTM